MLTSTANLSGARYFLVITAGLFLMVAICACRKGAKPNSNTNAGSSSITSDPEQAKRQAQSLVDQGKEFYKNDQDEQSAGVLKQAIAQDQVILKPISV